MKVTDFAKEVTLHEGNKKSLSIAQVAEVLKIVDNLTEGSLYKTIRGTQPKPAAKKASAKVTATKKTTSNVAAKKGNSRKN